MSAGPSAFSSHPLIQPGPTYQRLCNDLTVVMATLELVGQCEDLPADLRRLVEAANRRLLATAQWLRGDETGDRNTPPRLSVAH